MEILQGTKHDLFFQGYNQGDVIDYDETFAPVARMEATRILIAFALHMEFTLFQMDVKSAFPSGFLKKEVYIKLPPDFERHVHPEHKEHIWNGTFYGAMLDLMGYKKQTLWLFLLLKLNTWLLLLVVLNYYKSSNILKTED
uniref:Uncharacterized protein LOC104221416 n=1 Tax=Nicotiana sylvestris TaxID=4096 RepID=A0A1U7VWL9_NICSY|nr:PREDICTED: uncharacterized protein LOC104221416 [Nicotiana sylvestris]